MESGCFFPQQKPQQVSLLGFSDKCLAMIDSVRIALQGVYALQGLHMGQYPTSYHRRSVIVTWVSCPRRWKADGIRW